MTMTLHCFGASTSSGHALHQLCTSGVFGYSRNPSSSSDWLYSADLNDPLNFKPASRYADPAIWISFAPIWLFAPFLDQLAIQHPERLQGLQGVIACSSSSIITKRFAANRFDRELVARLARAEALLLSTCRGLSLPCRILRPSLIYGLSGDFGDRNLSRLLRLIRVSPLVLLPVDCGLRQPIHASQLAAVALRLAQQLSDSAVDPSLPVCIAVGGDSTLTYAEMIRALQQAQPSGDSARRCSLLSIPNRLFFLLAAPLLLRSPKAFEAVLRMSANLSGFTPAYQLLGSEPQPFPVLPLA